MGSSLAFRTVREKKSMNLRTAVKKRRKKDGRPPCSAGQENACPLIEHPASIFYTLRDLTLPHGTRTGGQSNGKRGSGKRYHGEKLSRAREGQSGACRDAGAGDVGRNDIGRLRGNREYVERQRGAGNRADQPLQFDVFQR